MCLNRYAKVPKLIRNGDRHRQSVIEDRSFCADLLYTFRCLAPSSSISTSASSLVKPTWQSVGQARTQLIDTGAFPFVSQPSQPSLGICRAYRLRTGEFRPLSFASILSGIKVGSGNTRISAQGLSNAHLQRADLVTCGLRADAAISLARISCLYRSRGQHANIAVPNHS